MSRRFTTVLRQFYDSFTKTRSESGVSSRNLHTRAESSFHKCPPLGGRPPSSTLADVIIACIKPVSRYSCGEQSHKAWKKVKK